MALSTQISLIQQEYQKADIISGYIAEYIYIYIIQF